MGVKWQYLQPKDVRFGLIFIKFGNLAEAAGYLQTTYFKLRVFQRPWVWHSDLRLWWRIFTTCQYIETTLGRVQPVDINKMICFYTRLPLLVYVLEQNYGEQQSAESVFCILTNVSFLMWTTMCAVKSSSVLHLVVVPALGFGFHFRFILIWVLFSRFWSQTYSGFHASFAEDELQLLYQLTCTDEWTPVKSPTDKTGVAK